MTKKEKPTDYWWNSDDSDIKPLKEKKSPYTKKREQAKRSDITKPIFAGMRRFNRGGKV